MSADASVDHFSRFQRFTIAPVLLVLLIYVSLDVFLEEENTVIRKTETVVEIVDDNSTSMISDPGSWEAFLKPPTETTNGDPMLRSGKSEARKKDNAGTKGKTNSTTELKTNKPTTNPSSASPAKKRLTSSPTKNPATKSPIASPSKKPTDPPSPSPTNKPTNPPSPLPTYKPTSSPATEKPSTSPPSPSPTNKPTPKSANDVKSSSNQRGKKIPLDPNATLAKDVLSIHHFAQQSQLVVSLRANATCPRPYLVGRLSGPALVKIEYWKWNLASDNSTTLEATYQVPLGGTYTVEIVAIYCNNFYQDYLEHAKSTGNKDDNSTDMVNMRSFDFKKVCIEDPFHNRLTDYDASIRIVSPSQKLIGSSNDAWTGYWYPINASTTPVHTRFQPTICYERIRFHKQFKDQPTPALCASPTNTTALEAYEFRWHPSPILPATIQPPEPHTICVAGASHSYYMRQHSGKAKLGHYNIQFRHIDARYPEDLLAEKVFDKPCNSLVIGTGQWPASFDRKRPHTANEFYNDLTQMVQRLENANITHQMPVFLRSIHYDALMGRQNYCPPTDWRTPVVIDAYNTAIQQIANTANVTYLDTSFLVGPVWDSAPDYCHLREDTGIQEALYIAAIVLGGKPSDDDSSTDTGRRSLMNISRLDGWHLLGAQGGPAEMDE